MATKPGKTLKRIRSVNRRQLILVASSFVATGVLITFFASAAGQFTAKEVEAGQISSPATIVASSGASGGQAVKFGGTPTPSATPSSEMRYQAYTTAYTYYDNTPPGSADISNPVIHAKAGGTGTYADPITIAIGHSIINGNDILDYPAGTKFYIPNVRRYFIVEDTCGDGATPQNGPCHTGYPTGTTTWVDMWIDGQSGTQSAVDACAGAVTDANGVAHLLIRNPASNYLVVSGPVFNNGQCTQQFGNTPVTQ